MRKKDKTTRCQSRGRHEYRIVYEDVISLDGICACGKSIHEPKGDALLGKVKQ